MAKKYSERIKTSFKHQPPRGSNNVDSGAVKIRKPREGGVSGYRRKIVDFMVHGSKGNALSGFQEEE